MNIKVEFHEYLCGFTIIELMIVVAIISLLFTIALPNFIKARNTSRAKLCANNKKLIGHSVEQYMIGNDLNDPTIITLNDIADYIKGGVPECPSDLIDDDNDYSIGAGTGGGVLVSCEADPTHVPPYDTGAPE